MAGEGGEERLRPGVLVEENKVEAKYLSLPSLLGACSGNLGCNAPNCLEPVAARAVGSTPAAPKCFHMSGASCPSSTSGWEHGEGFALGELREGVGVCAPRPSQGAAYLHRG